MHLVGPNKQFGIHIKLSQAKNVGLITPKGPSSWPLLTFYLTMAIPCFYVSMNIHECENERIFITDFLTKELVKLFH